jgi:energy-coupling factor transport system permease protein
VLEGALERSLALAAAMDSRGFGRLNAIPPAQRRVTTALTMTGLIGVLVGAYALLDAGTPVAGALTMLAAGVALTLAGLHRANRRAVRTVYRPDPWRWPEHLTVASGLLAAGVYAVVASVDPAAMLPATSPLVWPALPALPMAATLLAAAPARLTPPVPSASGSTPPQPARELVEVAA